MVEKEQLVAMVQGMQAGDEAATALMYETFHEDFYYFILKTVNNDRELAEDLTQDTFLEILETIHKLEEPVAFVTWAKQIAYHKCTGYFRKKKELLLDENEDGTTAFDIQVEENAEFIPDEALDNKELKQTLMEMINELPEEQRAALLLRYFNEISVKEIAQIQNVSEGTIKSRLNYARKSIKQAVESYEKKNGVKLRCVGVLPLLLWLFREYRMANKLSMATGTAAQTFVLAEETAAAAGIVATGSVATGAATTTAATTATAATTTATTTAAAVAAKSAAVVGVKAAATALSTKVIAGVVAVAMVAGGTAAGISAAKKNDAPQQPTPETAIVQMIEETDAVVEETVTEETAAVTEATEATVEPTDCEHVWAYSHEGNGGIFVYECANCGTTWESYECTHPGFSQENWTDPADGTVYTIETCTLCGAMYSYTGTPGEEDYVEGNGAPDNYNPVYPEEEPEDTEAEETNCRHPSWKADMVVDTSTGDQQTTYTCKSCGYSYTETITNDNAAEEDVPCAHENTYYSDETYDLLCADCGVLLQAGFYEDVEGSASDEEVKEIIKEEQGFTTDEEVEDYLNSIT